MQVFRAERGKLYIKIIENTLLPQAKSTALVRQLTQLRKLYD